MATESPSSIDAFPPDALPMELSRPRSAGRPRSASRFQSTLANLAEDIEHAPEHEEETGDVVVNELLSMKQGTLTDGILAQESGDERLADSVEEPLVATVFVPVRPATVEQSIDVTSKRPDKPVLANDALQREKGHTIGPSLHRWFQRYDSVA
jgi:hypothetical protein